MSHNCDTSGYQQRELNEYQNNQSHVSLMSSTTTAGTVGNVSTTATLGAGGHHYNSYQPNQQYQQQQHQVSTSDSNSMSSGSYTTTGAYLSDVELAILKSAVPINLPHNSGGGGGGSVNASGDALEEISVLGQRGIWANKQEVVNWRGPRPISEYPINVDDAPEMLVKRTQEMLTYIQELAVRYLKPPSPPPPGEIIIQEESNSLTPPAPPLIIRQQPPRPCTPEPLVIREAPPPAPPKMGRRVITISGKRLPPPPRKVVIERLAPLPPKPQSVIIERWLPYTPVKRRVIYQRGGVPDPVVVKPRNIIVQWEAPQVQIRKDFKYLGIIRANPVEYVQRYGSQLKTTQELPSFVLDIKPPEGIVLAADYQYNQVHELEGDVDALRLIDLENEGLAEYKSQVTSYVSTNQLVARIPVSQQQHHNHHHHHHCQHQQFSSTTTEKNNNASIGTQASTLSTTVTVTKAQINNQTVINVAQPTPLSPIAQTPVKCLSPVQSSNATSQHQQLPIVVALDPLQPIQYNTNPYAAYQPYIVPAAASVPPVQQSQPDPNAGAGTYSTSSIKSYNSNMLDIVSEIFTQVAADSSRLLCGGAATVGRLSLEEAEKLLLKLNSRLGRRYSEDDLKRFFYSLNIQQDGTISLEEFRVAFERVL